MLSEQAMTPTMGDYTLSNMGQINNFRYSVLFVFSEEHGLIKKFMKGNNATGATVKRNGVPLSNVLWRPFSFSSSSRKIK